MIEDKIKRYFLGELSEPEAIGFEETFALNPEFTEQAQLVESELIDDYLQNRLSHLERNLFETNYLTTAARQAKVKFAETFLGNFKLQHKPETQPSAWRNIFADFQFPRLAFASISVILLFGGFIYFWQSWQNKPEIAKQQITNQTPTPQIEVQNTPINQNTNLENRRVNINSGKIDSNVQNAANIKKPTPTPEIKSAQTPTPKSVEQPVPTLASFVLLPGTLRGEGEQSVKMSKQTNKVNLKLNLPKDASKYQTYTATIKTAEGETVANFPNLKALNLTLSANKLTNRTYIIFLEGKNAEKPAESVGEYTFLVNR